MRALLVILAVAAFAATGTAAEQKAAPPAKAAAGAKATPASPVNLNTATQAQLETLPGVGAKAAQRILEYRQKNGNFKKIEEIIEFQRSCPCLLQFLVSKPRCGVARSRPKGQ
ncbi:MAG TPA: helix-hairpin-helix domain-containing protein [Vicinamibacterales bacterium]|nr:helix-hairpin-helix domain-containing protein [Vicinamibacterales bacterium]